MPRVATSTAILYVKECPVCHESIDWPFHRADSNVAIMLTHNRADCGARLAVFIDGTNTQHRVERIPHGVRMEDVIRAYDAHDGPPWRNWSIREAVA